MKKRRPHQRKRRLKKRHILCVSCGKWAATERLFLRDLDLRTAQRLLHLPASRNPSVYEYPEILVCKFCALDALGDTDERVLELERKVRDLEERVETLASRGGLDDDDS